MSCQPLLDRFGFMNFVVIDDHIDMPALSLRVRAIHQGE
jgi:hypothetical protein